MSPASQRLSMGRLLCWSILASGCVSSLAVAQQPVQPKPVVPKVAKPVPKPPTAAEVALAEERVRIKTVSQAITKVQTKISQLYRAGQIGAADQAEVDQYFVNYIDVLSSPGGALEMPDARQKIRAAARNFGNPSNPMEKSAQVYVNNLLLRLLSEAAADEKYLPHGRYNCMLALGELNEQEPNSGGVGPVKPLPQAVPILIKAALQPDMLAGVKVAALIGLQRHAKLGIADQNREREVVLELSKLVQQATPPPLDSPEGHHWMRRQAIDVLISLKQPGPGNEAVTALTAAVFDKNNPMWVRLDALRALGQLKVPANAMGEEATPILGTLTLDLLKNETNYRALRLGCQSVVLGLQGNQDAQGGVIVSLAGEDKKQGEQLRQRAAICLSLVQKLDATTMKNDPTAGALVLTQIQTEAASLELWLAGEDPNAPAAP